MQLDLRMVPIGDVFESPFNTRKHFDSAKMQELEASVRTKGVLTPLIVRPTGHGFEVAAGHRRLRAARAADVADVPVRVIEMTDVEFMEVLTIENLQREDIHPLDEAEGYQALMKTAGKASGYNVSVVAAKVGKSESYVYRRLKLLELEDDLTAALAEDRLSVAHAEKLLRLPEKLRKEAADPHKGVVWRDSPLLRTGQWIPQREDLRPLHELEYFIRTRHHFDPASRDVRHFQEELAEQIDEAVGAPPAGEIADFGRAMDADAAVASLVSLSVDPMVRMRLRANPKDPVPLSPSKWREVKSEAGRCAHTVLGAITHGGPARILHVCTKKSCPRHFPVAKKKPAKKGEASTAAKQESSWEAQQRRQREAQHAWDALAPAAQRAFATHLADVKLSLVAVMRTTMSSHQLKAVEKNFGVALNEDTALQVLVLCELPHWNMEGFASAVKPWGFDFKAWKKQFDKQVAAAGKAALAAQREQLTGSGAKARNAKASAAKKASTRTATRGGRK